MAFEIRNPLISYLISGPINTPLFQANTLEAAQDRITSALAIERL
jgi:hypothetical protein